ncbi:hypothetical protein HOLleu_02376 [Holothuria leucospilota]|uniref:Immunoglobulin domain-containing protein n=1 Tax=Holothuria leucospilota TaxID=206669 RepID=A0A9Q1CR80_HOLLE|nr:hypothetical protein HOLleu_02376 [Holothuria leucospilota]
MKIFHLTAILCFHCIKVIAIESRECSSTQYVKEGFQGVVQCSFREDVFNVLWYNSSDFFRYDPIVTLKQSVKGGIGFISGEFDIYPNGSLIIRNVSLKHEGTYIVIELDTPTSKTRTYTVSVLVIAQTFDRLPIIDKCDNEIGICYQIIHRNSEISCTMKDAREAIPLTWMVRTTNGDRNTSSQSVITNETNIYFTSRTATHDTFAYSEILTLLVCKADSPPGLLERNESLVLLQNNDETLMNIKPKQVVVEVDSTVQLHCNNGKLSYLVWQVKKSPVIVFKTILYAVFVGGNFTQINDEDYKLQQTSLVINKIRVQEEGTYRCVSGNGLEDDVIVYSVILFVYPDPPYVVVDGCSHQQYCVLEVQSQGSLTCTVNGIYPQVNLDIAKVFNQSSNVLNFYDKSLTARENGKYIQN